MGRVWATLKSIRFRLTAWYSLLLIVVLFLAGFGLLTVMEARLRANLDQRLVGTARTIVADRYLERLAAAAEESGVLGQRNWRDQGGLVADLNDFPGTVIQVISADGDLILGSIPFCQVLDDPPAGDAPQSLTTMERCGTPLRVLTRSVRLNDQIRDQIGGSLLPSREPVMIVVAQSLGPLDETLRSLRNAMGLIGIVGIFLAVLGGWILAGRVLAPIDDITAAAAKIAESSRTGASLSTRLDVPPTADEVARLSSTFNRMLDRLQVAFDSREQFVANASHELRTPLAAIRGNLDVLARQFERLRGSDQHDATSLPPTSFILEDISEAVGDLQRESARMSRLLDDLLFLARADAGADAVTTDTHVPLRLDEQAASAVRVAANLIQGQKLSVETNPALIRGDADRITQLTLILLDNAIRHTSAGKEIHVSVGVEGEKAVLRVADEGDGIAAEHLPLIFDRFYRVDSARSRTSGGSGLGLSIAKVIAQTHQAEMTVQSALGRGSTFTVYFPLITDDPLTTRSPQLEAGPGVSLPTSPTPSSAGKA